MTNAEGNRSKSLQLSPAIACDGSRHQPKRSTAEQARYVNYRQQGGVLLEGRIIKVKANFYFVQEMHTHEITVCSARGKFKGKGIDLMVGDMVKISRIDSREGVIEDVLPRNNKLLRPPVANVDQAVVLASVDEPAMDLFLLDRIIISAEAAGLEITICFNKHDLLNGRTEENLSEAKDIYKNCGYNVIITSALIGEGLEEFKAALQNKISVLAGPSGVGKSTLINKLHPGLQLEVAPVSRKTKKGKHTTRHVELLQVEGNSYVVDTPGFQKLNLNGISSSSLAWLFPEISHIQNFCYFKSCYHNAEPECAVKDAVQTGDLAPWRYKHYLTFLKEIREKEKIY